MVGNTLKSMQWAGASQVEVERVLGTSLPLSTTAQTIFFPLLDCNLSLFDISNWKSWLAKWHMSLESPFSNLATHEFHVDYCFYLLVIHHDIALIGLDGP